MNADSNTDTIFDAAEFRAQIAKRWAQRGRRHHLAALTGYSVGYIALIEKGYHPSAEAQRRIFEALGLDAARAIRRERTP